MKAVPLGSMARGLIQVIILGMAKNRRMHKIVGGRTNIQLDKIMRDYVTTEQFIDRSLSFYDIVAFPFPRLKLTTKHFLGPHNPFVTMEIYLEFSSFFDICRLIYHLCIYRQMLRVIEISKEAKDYHRRHIMLLGQRLKFGVFKAQPQKLTPICLMCMWDKGLHCFV